MQDKPRFGDAAEAQVIAGGGGAASVRFRGQFNFELCANRLAHFFDEVRERGFLTVWRERCKWFHKGFGWRRWVHILKVWSPHRVFSHVKEQWSERNRVVNEGLQHILDILFVSATAQIDPWYVGLLAASPTPLAAWGATEIGANDFVAYDETNLQSYVDVRSAQSVTNAASKASFAINADTSSIGGAFLISTNAKGTPAGTLLCAVAFTGGNKAAGQRPAWRHDVHGRHAPDARTPRRAREGDPIRQPRCQGVDDPSVARLRGRV
jgi:hypothetical protein